VVLLDSVRERPRLQPIQTDLNSKCWVKQQTKIFMVLIGTCVTYCKPVAWDHRGSRWLRPPSAGHSAFCKWLVSVARLRLLSRRWKQALINAWG
jgi:hypothetical protein